MRLKKILTILLTLAMVVSLLPATAFAANNTATTMRLEKTQGTVNVTNSTGKAVTKTDKMKLYNGYKVKTGAKSYAWISLDDTKVAKLDANSSMEVQKSGKDLTLYLSSGSMFFNVKDPLPKGENFNIRTSTMTTGIRGTSGCVRIISDRVTEVHLLTGQVEIFASHPGLGLSKHAVLKAGQKATSLIDWEAMAATGEMVDILIEPLLNHEVCGNCAQEIKADAALRERIEREAPHLLPEQIAGSADERLAADEAVAEAKQAIIDEAIAKQEFPEDVDPYFEETVSGGGGGGGGGSSSGGNTTTVTETVNTWARLAEAIDEFNAGNEDMTLTLGADLPTREELAAGIQASLPAVNNTSGKNLTLNLSDYTLTLTEALVNRSDLTITNVKGYIIGSGQAPAVINYADATLTLLDGQIDGNGATALVNNGTFIMQGGELVAVPGNGTTAPSALQLNGGMTMFEGGTILAEGSAIAVQAASEDYFDSEITTTIRAAERTTVFVVANQGLPTGYSIEEDGSYYVLVNENGEVVPPVESETTVYVNGTGDFVTYLHDFDGSTDKMIIFNTDDAITEEVITYVEESLGESIGDVEVKRGDATLVIDLNGHNLTITSTSLNSQNTDGLVNKGNLIIKDSAGGGTITGSTANLLYNSNTGTLDLQGGTITISADTTYRAVENVSDMTMSGGAIVVEKGNGIDLQSGKLTMKGGTITVNGESSNGIYANTSEDLKLQDGSIIVTNTTAGGISVSQVGRIILEDTVVKGKDAENLLVGYYDTEFTVTEQPDDEGYYFLTGIDNGPSAEELAEAQVEFAYQLARYNVEGATQTIALTNDVTFDSALMMELSSLKEDLLAMGYPRDYLAVDNLFGADYLEIDLNGHNLIMATPLENYSGLIITDSVGGGSVTGTADVLFRSYDTFELDNGAIAVSKANGAGIVAGSGGEVTLTGGSITVTESMANGISVPTADKLTLGSATVKGLNADNLLLTTDGNETGFTTEGPDASGYYTLVVGSSEVEPEEDVIEVSSEQEFAKKIAAHTAATTDTRIVLTKDLDFTSKVATEDGYIPAEEVMSVSGNSTKKLTIDLGEYDLTLNNNMFSNYGTLTITGTSGVMTGGTWYVIDNKGDLTLEGGTIQLTANEEYTYMACVRNYNDGTFTLDGGNLEVINKTVTDSSRYYGLYLSNATATIESGTIIADGVYGAGAIYHTDARDVTTIKGGEIYIGNGTGLSGVGTYIFEGGVVEASSTAIAVDATNFAAVPEAIGTTIRVINDGLMDTTEQEQVYIGTIPTGYSVVEDGDYYVLKANADVEEVDAAVVTQMFRELVYAGQTEIALTGSMNGDIHLTSEILGEEDTLKIDYFETNNRTLTIDLMGHDMTLDAPIYNNGTNTTLTIKDSVGGGVISGSADMLIKNEGILNLQGVEMAVNSKVAEEAFGVYGGTVNITGNTEITLDAPGAAVFAGMIYMQNGTLVVKDKDGRGLQSMSAYRDANGGLMENVTVSDSNITVNNGGTGIYMDHGMVGLYGGNIEVEEGIGIYASTTADKDAVAVMNSGNITVEGDGAVAVGVSGAEFRMNAGQIDVFGNDGVGVEVDTFKMNGGKLTAQVEGAAAVCVGNNAQIELSDGEIIANGDTDEESGVTRWTATAIEVKATDENGGLDYSGIRVDKAGIVQAAVREGAITDPDKFMELISGYIVYNDGNYYTIVPQI